MELKRGEKRRETGERRQESGGGGEGGERVCVEAEWRGRVEWEAIEGESGAKEGRDETGDLREGSREWRGEEVKGERVCVEAELRWRVELEL